MYGVNTAILFYLLWYCAGLTLHSKQLKISSWRKFVYKKVEFFDQSTRIMNKDRLDKLTEQLEEVSNHFEPTAWTGNIKLLELGYNIDSFNKLHIIWMYWKS